MSASRNPFSSAFLRGDADDRLRPQGKLSFTPHPEVKVHWDEKEKSVLVSTDENAPGFDEISQHWGTARATIKVCEPASGRMKLETTCSNQHGKVVLAGEADVLYEPPAA